MVSLSLLVCPLILSAYRPVHLQLQWLLSVALEPDITSLIMVQTSSLQCFGTSFNPSLGNRSTLSPLVFTEEDSTPIPSSCADDGA
ncbi:hypothetical protein NC652_009755 [Populus alba x Populus x berolinensis]|nr:hypothetical protein NC652_009755 [Populus alba x Populus x berolinensis]